MLQQTRLVVWTVLMVLVAAILATWIHGLASRVSDAEKQATANRAAAEQLARQVKGLGGEPVVEPSTLPRVPTSEPGKSGAQGPSGPSGATGPGPSWAQIAASVADYCAHHNKCTGPAGATGQPGKDSTVPGPAGAAGKDGKDGSPGKDGADSTVPGPQGPAGADGATGAAGYPASLRIPVDGTNYVCTDPDGDHAYTCSAA